MSEMEENRRPDGVLREEIKRKLEIGEPLTEMERKELDRHLDFMPVNEIASLLPDEEQARHDRFDDARDDNLDQLGGDDAVKDARS